MYASDALTAANTKLVRSSASVLDMRMPLPPPPSEALSITGYPIFAADATALAALGLPQRAPDERRADRVVWTSVPGYREVTLIARTGTGDPGFVVKWRTP